MAKWKNLAALDAAARLGQTQLERERLRGVRDAHTTSAVLQAVNQLLNTGVNVGGQLYQGASDNLAQDILAGRESFEAPEAPSFADDPLAATAAFLGRGVRQDAQRKALTQAQAMAPQRFEQLAPRLVQAEAAAGPQGFDAPEQRQQITPQEFDQRVGREMVNAGIDDDPVLALLPESMRASYKAKVADLSAQKAEAAEDKALTRRVQQGQISDREAKYLGMALTSDARAALEPGGSLAELEAKAEELAPDLGPLERQSAIEAALENARKSVTDQALAEAKLQGYLTKAKKGDDKKTLTTKDLDALNSRREAINAVDDLQRYYEANKGNIRLGAVREALDRLATLPLVGDATDALKALTNRGSLSTAEAEFIRRAGMLNFKIATSVQEGVMTDSDWRMWQSFLSSPYAREDVWRAGMDGLRKEMAAAYRHRVEDYSEFYKIPQRHLELAGLAPREGETSSGAPKAAGGSAKSKPPHYSAEVANYIDALQQQGKRAYVDAETGEVAELRHTDGTPVSAEEAAQLVREGRFLTPEDAARRGMALKLAPEAPGTSATDKLKSLGDAALAGPATALFDGAEVADKTIDLAKEGARRAADKVTDFLGEVDARVGEWFSPTYGLSVRDRDVLESTFGDEAKRIYVQRREAGDSADEAAAKAKAFVQQKAKELQAETAGPNPADIRNNALSTLIGAPSPTTPAQQSLSPQELLKLKPVERRAALSGEYAEIWNETYGLYYQRALNNRYAPTQAQAYAERAADAEITKILREDAGYGE